MQLEEQNLHLNRELNNLRSQIEEQERDADENLTNYKNLIQKVIIVLLFFLFLFLKYLFVICKLFFLALVFSGFSSIHRIKQSN